MNYPTFLKEIDRHLESIDLESLRLFVHELARTQPEVNRERFLDLLNQFSDYDERKQTKESQKTDTDRPSLSAKVSDMMDTLQSIIDGESKLDSEYNEEWDDWNDSEDEEFNFSDPDGLLEDLQDAFKLQHSCYDQGEYQDGARLADLLSSVEVQVSGDYGDSWDSSFDLGDLVARDLLSINLSQATVEAAYLACMGNPENSRVDAILNILHNMCAQDVTLEKILQAGNAEINLNTFLPRWVEALGSQTGQYNEALLKEAFEMLPDMDSKVKIAKQYAASHPALFQTLLESGKDTGKDQEYLSIATDALNLIPVNQTVRSSVALLAADYALAIGEQSTAEKAWMEAFRSSPTVINYLRLRLLSKHWEDFSDAVSAICDQASTPYSPYKEGISPALLFYNGEFDKFQTRFMNVTKGIGWSSTFMKQGLALFLLLFQSGSLDTSCMREMLTRAKDNANFTCSSFYAGTGQSSDREDTAEFQSIFLAWKSSVHIPDDLRESILAKIRNWLSVRVAAIMEANRRNYYGECAEYIAAYGEVLESNGEKGAKQAVLGQYQDEYSRRRAFIGDLRRFGLRG
ncbi:MAG: hypothetical protein IJ088_12230 [Clostridia bacterium]|nr:hypothetical protein [Clostridia bacterium]